MRTSAVLSALALALSTTVAAAQPAKPAPAPAPAPARPATTGTQLHWYGHAAFKIVTPRGKTLLVDPWLANPGNPTGKDEVKSVAADLILVSHGHGDHIGDAVEIGKRTKAKLVATADLGAAIVASGYPKNQFDVLDSGGNFGGTVSVLDGEVAITFVPAVHSSGVGDDKKYGGHPGGFVIAVKGGPTLYHTGDTDVFGDMALIGKLAKIDVMLACIGGHFTMDAARAAEAVRLVKPRQVVPMHFGTFPQLAGTPAQLGTALKKVAPATKLLVMERGKPIVLPATR